MALLDYALTTRARVKTFLGITSTDDDTLLDSLINVVTNFIENYCDRRFKLTTYTDEVYDGNGSQQMLLKQYPVVAFTQLGERDSVDNQSSWTAIDSEDYFVNLVTGIIDYINGLFRRLPRHYRATYQAGYDVDVSDIAKTLEAAGAGDLEFACWSLVSDMYDEYKGEADITSESLGDYSVSYAAVEENPVIKNILEKYKRPYQH